MSPVITIAGKSGTSSKPKPKRARAKAPAKAKPAAKPKAKAKAKAKPAAKPKPAQNNGSAQRIAKDGRVLRVPKDLDPKVMRDFEGQLSEAGSRVKEAKAEHDQAIDDVHTVVSDAQEAGVPMAIIEDVTGISRQWLYKMGQFKGRKADNGDAEEAAPAPKPKRAAAKGSARKSSPAKRATSAANKTAKRGGSSIVKLAG